MRWGNDTYMSTPHRVLPPAQQRYSIALFGFGRALLGASQRVPESSTPAARQVKKIYGR